MSKFIFLVLSFVLYLLAPAEYSFAFCTICAIIFVLHFVRVIQLDSRNYHDGIVDFNLLFSLSSFAVVYVFPLFIYGTSSDYSFRHLSVFDETAINKVTALSTFAYEVYLISYEYYFISSLESRSFTSIRIKVWSLFLVKTVTIISVIFFTLNILFFIRTVDSSHNDMDVNAYSAELTKCFLTICLLCCCEKHKVSIRNSTKSFFYYCFVPLVCFLVVMMEYMFIGDRGFVIVGSLMVVFVYNHYVAKTKTVFLIPFTIGAIVLMSLVGQLRKTENSFREGGVSSFVAASKEILGSSSNENHLEFISDLTLVSNVAYLEWDYSVDNTLYKPTRLIVILSMPIPLAPTLFSELMYAESGGSESTGYAVTQFYYSKVSNPGKGGLGTHMVMDLYMSWRLVGVILGMWLLGLIIGKASAFKFDNIYYLILLITFFGLAIYLPRSTIYVCFRTIVWEILFLFIFTKVEKYKTNR